MIKDRNMRLNDSDERQEVWVLCSWFIWAIVRTIDEDEEDYYGKTGDLYWYWVDTNEID